MNYELFMGEALAEAYGGFHGGRRERMHRHHGPRGFDWGFWAGPWARGFPFGGGRPGWSRGRKAKRGDVRAAILALLAEEPMNGYGIITAVAERSDGSWQPGPGSVYPALRSLDEEGLIAPEESDDDPRRKVFALTDDGRAYAEAHGDELAQAFVDATTPRRGFREMRREIGQLVVVDPPHRDRVDLQRTQARCLRRAHPGEHVVQAVAPGQRVVVSSGALLSA